MISFDRRSPLLTLRVDIRYLAQGKRLAISRLAADTESTPVIIDPFINLSFVPIIRCTFPIESNLLRGINTFYLSVSMKHRTSIVCSRSLLCVRRFICKNNLYGAQSIARSTCSIRDKQAYYILLPHYKYTIAKRDISILQRTMHPADITYIYNITAFDEASNDFNRVLRKQTYRRTKQ